MQKELTLIDKAAEMCGSYTELAKRLGVHRVAVAQMRSGIRQISPETAAELADIVGEDAREAAIQSMINNAKGTRREGALKAILGKAVAVGAVGVLAFSYNPEQKGETNSANSSESGLTRYTSWNVIRRRFLGLGQVKRVRGLLSSDHGGGPPYPRTAAVF